VDRLGIEIHPFTEVTAIQTTNGNGVRRVEGVVTTAAPSPPRTVVNATAGWCSTIAHMAGIELRS